MLLLMASRVPGRRARKLDRLGYHLRWWLGRRARSLVAALLGMTGLADQAGMAVIQPRARCPAAPAVAWPLGPSVEPPPCAGAEAGRAGEAVLPELAAAGEAAGGRRAGGELERAGAQVRL